MKIKEKIRKKIPIKILKLRKYILNNFFIKYLFKKNHGYELNLNNPKTFSEKIQFRKKYGNMEEMSKVADKYLVRKYVKKKIGGEYLVPLLGVFNKITVEDLKKLPNEFVIKTNHGSGSNHLEIVKDKNKVNLLELVKKMNKAVGEKFGKETGELFYTLIDPKIIVEKLLLIDNKIPEDYKIHVFYKSEELYIQVDQDRGGNHKRNIYDSNFEFLEMKHCSGYDHFQTKDKPETLTLMKKLAKELGKDFDYIRVDFYSVNGKVYFGELTQTHGGGYENFEPMIWDFKLGELWGLDYKNERLYSKKNPLKSNGSDEKWIL